MQVKKPFKVSSSLVVLAFLVPTALAVIAGLVGYKLAKEETPTVAAASTPSIITEKPPVTEKLREPVVAEKPPVTVIKPEPAPIVEKPAPVSPEKPEPVKVVPVPVPEKPMPIPEPTPVPEKPAVTTLEPVPDMASRLKTEKLIKELFKDSYAKRKASELDALAEELMKQYRETKDDLTSRFVLLQEVRDITAKTGNLAKSLEAIDEMAKTFKIDKLDMKYTSIQVSAGEITTQAAHRALCDQVLIVIDEAITSDAFDVVKELLKIAGVSANKSKHMMTIKSVKDKGLEVAEIQKAWSDAQEGVVTLGTDPSDKQANLKVGSYTCFFKGDWTGLKMLVNGSDEKLKVVAKSDLASPTQSADRSDLGDMWWDLAEKSQSLPKIHLTSRALYWYKQCNTAELAGLTKTRVERRIEEAEKFLKPFVKTSPTTKITNAIGMQLVSIPAGKFMMGSPDGEQARGPQELQHEVTISKAFYMGKFPVTQLEYFKVMRQNPSYFNASKGGTAQCPVDSVTWNEATEFCRRLSAMEEEKKNGRSYRLPTEAEWEYACRAGTKTSYPFGEDYKKLQDYAWYSVNSGDHTHPVGGKLPNGWGLYDMQGNVWEWCKDNADPDYYKNSPKEDPQGPDDGTKKVQRGGSRGDTPTEKFQPFRSAYRHLYSGPDERHASFGFRVVMVVTK